MKQSKKSGGRPPLVPRAPASPLDRVTRIVNLVAAVATVATFLHGSYYAALWLLTLLIVGAVYFLSRNRSIAAATAIVAVAAAGAVQYSVSLRDIFDPPFAIGIETALDSDPRGRSMFAAEYGGRFICPIAAMLFIQVVNKQDISSTVSDLNVQVESRAGLWGLRRQWLGISQLPGYMPLVNVNVPPGSPTQRVTLLGPLLEPVLQRPLGAHETVRGWLLFDAPAAFDSVPRPLVFRLTITDSAGRSTSVVVSKIKDLGNMTPDRGFKLEPASGTIKNPIVQHFFYP